MIEDTIAAIATGMTSSGIGIVRVSGKSSIAIVDKVFKGKRGGKLGAAKSHTAHYGHIYDKDILIDEVIVLVMRSPHSYTKEDTVEINCHGGLYVITRVLETVIKYGARAAEPGEFTKRAFLSGRIDLSEAEAVMDVIQAKNNYALQNSLKQLSGHLYKKINGIRESILYENARIESALDDPEHISLEGYGDELLEKIRPLCEELKKLLFSYDSGKLLSEGIQTVILGRPNVGKSSILNFLVGEEKAIVTEIAGTTRDIIEENIMIDGIPLHIIDTAGLRHTDDYVEKIGVERAKEKALKADLIIYVIDSSIGFEEEDEKILESIEEKKVIILLNKCDLEPGLEKFRLKKKENTEIIEVSAKEGTGMEKLGEVIKDMFLKQSLSMNDEIFITSARNKSLLEEALKSLQLVEKSILEDMPEDFYTIDLMNTYSCLGKIIGAETGEDLIDEIFGKFCMGK